MNKRKISIVFNLLILILEIIGFIVTISTNHRLSIEYYTEDSNILMLFSSFLFFIFLIFNWKIPKWLKIFKYTTTICLTMTFFVVIFVLAPMYNFNYGYLLLHNSLLYQHLLCPLLCLVTFILFDDINNLTLKDNILGLSFTMIYSLTLIPLNIFDIVEGPYPFLMVKNQSILASVIWFIILYLLAFFIAYVLRVLNKKFNR